MIDFAESRRNFEKSKMGQALLSGMIAIFFVVGGVSNMPRSVIKDKISPLTSPIARSVGLVQDWYMFSPSPKKTIDDYEIRVIMEDGSFKIHTVKPPSSRIDQQFTGTHWKSLIRKLNKRPKVRDAYLQWEARRLIDPGDDVLRIELIQRNEKINPPGVIRPRQVETSTVWTETMWENGQK